MASYDDNEDDDGMEPRFALPPRDFEADAAPPTEEPAAPRAQTPGYAELVGPEGRSAYAPESQMSDVYGPPGGTSQSRFLDQAGMNDWRVNGLTQRIYNGAEMTTTQFGPQERELLAAHGLVNQSMLSPAEQQRLTRLNQAMAGIQEDQDAGQLRADEAASAMTMIRQQSAPLMIRASQLPVYMARLQYMHMQHQAAQQQALWQENAAFRARTAQDRLHTVTMADGRQAHFFERDGQGGMQLIPDARPERPAVTPQMQRSIENDERRRIEHDIDVARRQTEAARRRDPNAPEVHPEWFIPSANRDMRWQADRQVEARTQQRLSALGGGEAGGGAQPAAQPGAQPGGQPGQGGQPAAPSQPQPLAPEAINTAEQQRHQAILGSHTDDNAPWAVRERLALNAEVHDMLRQAGGSVMNMAPPERQRYMQMIQAIAPRPQMGFFESFMHPERAPHRRAMASEQYRRRFNVFNR